MMSQNLKQFSVLYAEDELSLQKVMVEYLNTNFKQVYTAVDGEDALVKYKRHNPDVLIFDINMPKLDGLSAARVIRENNKKIPIIMFSAYHDKEKLFNSLDINVMSYTLKPINPFEFQKILDKLNETLLSNFFHITNTCIWNKEKEVLYQSIDEIDLTHKEKLLLKLLIERHKQCVSFEDIMAFVWINEPFKEISKDSAKQQIKLLRQKLPNGCIKSIPKVGITLI